MATLTATTVALVATPDSNDSGFESVDGQQRRLRCLGGGDGIGSGGGSDFGYGTGCGAAGKIGLDGDGSICGGSVSIDAVTLTMALGDGSELWMPDTSDESHFGIGVSKIDSPVWIGYSDSKDYVFTAQRYPTTPSDASLSLLATSCTDEEFGSGVKGAEGPLNVPQGTVGNGTSGNWGRLDGGCSAFTYWSFERPNNDKTEEAGLAIQRYRDRCHALRMIFDPIFGTLSNATRVHHDRRGQPWQCTWSLRLEALEDPTVGPLDSPRFEARDVPLIASTSAAHSKQHPQASPASINATPHTEHTLQLAVPSAAMDDPLDGRNAAPNASNNKPRAKKLIKEASAPPADGKPAPQGKLVFSSSLLPGAKHLAASTWKELDGEPQASDVAVGNEGPVAEARHASQDGALKRTWRGLRRTNGRTEGSARGGGAAGGGKVSFEESASEGATKGASEGATEGASEGATEGASEGATEGASEGATGRLGREEVETGGAGPSLAKREDTKRVTSMQVAYGSPALAIERLRKELSAAKAELPRTVLSRGGTARGGRGAAKAAQGSGATELDGDVAGESGRSQQEIDDDVAEESGRSQRQAGDGEAADVSTNSQGEAENSEVAEGSPRAFTGAKVVEENSRPDVSRGADVAELRPSDEAEAKEAAGEETSRPGMSRSAEVAEMRPSDEAEAKSPTEEEDRERRNVTAETETERLPRAANLDVVVAASRTQRAPTIQPAAHQMACSPSRDRQLGSLQHAPSMATGAAARRGVREGAALVRVQLGDAVTAKLSRPLRRDEPHHRLLGYASTSGRTSSDLDATPAPNWRAGARTVPHENNRGTPLDAFPSSPSAQPTPHVEDIYVALQPFGCAMGRLVAMPRRPQRPSSEQHPEKGAAEGSTTTVAPEPMTGNWLLRDGTPSPERPSPPSSALPSTCENDASRACKAYADRAHAQIVAKRLGSRGRRRVLLAAEAAGATWRHRVLEADPIEENVEPEAPWTSVMATGAASQRDGRRASWHCHDSRDSEQRPNRSRLARRLAWRLVGFARMAALLRATQERRRAAALCHLLGLPPPAILEQCSPFTRESSVLASSAAASIFLRDPVSQREVKGGGAVLEQPSRGAGELSRMIGTAAVLTFLHKYHLVGALSVFITSIRLNIGWNAPASHRFVLQAAAMAKLMTWPGGWRRDVDMHLALWNLRQLQCSDGSFDPSSALANLVYGPHLALRQRDILRSRGAPREVDSLQHFTRLLNDVSHASAGVASVCANARRDEKQDGKEAGAAGVGGALCKGDLEEALRVWLPFGAASMCGL
eukprot:gene2287-3006_t